MSPQAEYRVVKDLWMTPLWEAIEILALKQKVIDKRRADSTTLALVHEIFVIEADRCNNILKEIECSN